MLRLIAAAAPCRRRFALVDMTLSRRTPRAAADALIY
jgi:hypothetical protein